MTGFIKGLFGLNNQSSAPYNNDFFLDDDSAKSYGDIDYMRTAKTVRRTFPKGKGDAREMSVSSEEMRVATPQPSSAKMPASKKPSAPTFSSISRALPKSETPRRKADRSMDAFRKMAKDIGK